MRCIRFYVASSKERHCKPNTWLCWLHIKIMEILHREFGGATCYFGQGVWRHQPETVFVYEVILHKGNYKKYNLRTVALELARLAEQDCVLYTEHKCNGEFVYAKS